MTENATGLEQLGTQLDTLAHLQRIALMGPERVFRFPHRGVTISMHLPDAERDAIQKTVLTTGSFYEARLLERLRQRGLVPAGATILDLGANIGNHAVYFGAILGAARIIAVEPQPHCNAILRRNLELNGLSTDDVHEVMLGASKGKGAIARFDGGNLGATVMETSEDGPMTMTTVDTLTKSLKRVDFVKLDVEGFEEAVLDGSTAMIDKHRPVFWIELLGRSGSRANVIERFEKLGYTTERLSPRDVLFIPS